MKLEGKVLLNIKSAPSVEINGNKLHHNQKMKLEFRFVQQFLSERYLDNYLDIII